MVAISAPRSHAHEPAIRVVRSRPAHARLDPGWPALDADPVGPLVSRSDERPHSAGRGLPDRATRVRRRRLAVLLAVVVLAVLAVLAVRLAIALSDIGGSPGPEPLDDGQAPVAGRQYVVRPGDTLWTIATELAPDADPRPVVDALREANGGPVLEVGARLTVDLD
jgi:hypothetical protein